MASPANGGGARAAAAGDGAGGGSDKPSGCLSLGFSIKGKARPKVAVNVGGARQEEHKQLITAVAADGTIQTESGAAGGGGGSRQFVVPALQNTYRAGVGKFVPSFVPESSSAAVTGKAEDKYERADVGHAPSLSSFGLEVRRPGAKDAEAAAAAAAAAAADGSGGAAPVAAAAADENGAAPGSSSVSAVAGLVAAARAPRGDEAAQLKADLERLPDMASVEDYDSLPVEEFGKALLRGLGWSDGQGVGRKRQLVEAKQTVRRPERLGLGANPVAPPPDKRPRKMGDTPRPQDLVAAPTADGRVRHRVGLDEQLVPRASLAPGPQPGKVMAVVRGRHAGLLAAVRELRPAEGVDAAGPATRVLVELRPSGEVVEVAAAELDERDAAAAGRGRAAAAEEHGQPRGASGGRGASMARHAGSGGRECSRDREHGSRHRDRSRDGGQEGRVRDRHGERDRDRDRDRDLDRRRAGGGSSSRHGEQEHHGSSSRQQQQQQQQQQQRPPLRPSQLWVASLIRVRIVDKHIKGGWLYLKKGTVLDVHPDGSCEVQLEEGAVVVTVHQESLETVVPKEAGGPVMVLAGEHKGRKGRLLQASISGGAAAAQLLGDMQVVRLSLDDLAQFMGHLEEEDV